MAQSETITVTQQPPQPAPAPADDGGGFDIGGDGGPPADGGHDAGGVPDAGAAPPPAYSYSSAPRAISGGSNTGALSGTRLKYRDPAQAADHKGRSNIMFDKRVIRGNTRSAQVPTATQKIILDEEQKKLLRRRAAAEARRKKVLDEVEKTPFDAAAAPVDGRAHMSIQTDENQLEEITDKPAETDVSTQTEDVDDKPLPPLFMPKPLGRDQQTSIEPGELFDFGLSVEPILEVLIGKTLDQALTEVLEEQELAALRAQRAWFEQQKAIELAQVQSLEAEAKRKFEEKEARLREARARALAEQRVAEKNAAQRLAKQFLATLQDNTLNRLEAAGHFYDPVRRDVEHAFLPWLLERTTVAVRDRVAARQHVDAVLAAAMRSAQQQIDAQRTRERDAKAQAERDRLQAIAKADAERDAAAKAAADAAAKEAAERATAEEALKKRVAAAEEEAVAAKAAAKAEAKKKRDAELRKKLGALNE